MQPDEKPSRWVRALRQAKAERSEVRELMRHSELEKDDVLAVVRGLRQAKDLAITDSGIEPRPLEPHDEALLTEAELRAIKLAAKSLRLPFPCTPLQLLNWCGRHGYEPLGSFERLIVQAQAAPLAQDNTSEQGEARAGVPKAVPSNEIKNAFRQIKDVDDSDADSWWDERMRDAKRYDLEEARVQAGRAGRPSTWRPDVVAHWLVGKKHTEARQAARVLRKYFGDCSEMADFLDSPPPV